MPHPHTLAFPYSTEKEIDEGLRLGDYPVLPWRSAQQERPTGWWDNQDRRDKETPVKLCRLFSPYAVGGLGRILGGVLVI